jgi:hypothetical protein
VRRKASRKQPVLALEQITAALPRVVEVANYIKYVDVY